MADLRITESDGWHELDEFHERANEVQGLWDAFVWAGMGCLEQIVPFLDLWELTEDDEIIAVLVMQETHPTKGWQVRCWLRIRSAS